MAIRPADLQLLIPRSAEVNRTEHVDARRPEAMHQQFAATLQKKVEQDQQQVQLAYRAEQDGVDKDGSNKEKQERKKKNDGKRALREPDAARKASSTSMIDISI